MNIHQSIQSQYLASLKMLRQVIENCPDDVWNAQKDQNRFWHIAYHAIFYTHLYMQSDGSAFVPWHKGRTETHFMGQVPWPPHHAPEQARLTAALNCSNMRIWSGNRYWS